MSLRLVLHEADDASAVAERLRRGGFDAVVSVERLAGEDDEEDHPWAVVTDAPEYLLELLADEFDAWVDEERAAAAPAPGEPMELPDGPRRVKGHWSAGPESASG